MNISIKNVKEETWRVVKSEAAKHNLNIGDFLNKVLLEHKKREEEKNNWNEIMYGKRILKEKEIEKIRESMKDFRKELEVV